MKSVIAALLLAMSLSVPYAGASTDNKCPAPQQDKVENPVDAG